MDVLKIKTEDLRKLSDAELSESETEVKKQLAEIRIDVYGEPTAHLGNKRKLKKTFARIQSVKGEQKRKQS